jgi:hypothetical protein
MELRKLAVAIAALSFAVSAGAMGDKSSGASTTGGHNATSDQSSTSSTSADDASSNADASTIRAAQQALTQKGFDAGSPDGKMGPQTQSAVKQFQEAQKLPQTGTLDAQTLAALGVSEGGRGAGAASANSSGTSGMSSNPSGSSSMSSAPSSSSGTSSAPSSSSATSRQPSSSSGTPSTSGASSGTSQGASGTTKY